MIGVKRVSIFRLRLISEVIEHTVSMTVLVFCMEEFS